MSCATWLLVTGVPARCVVLYLRFPGPPGSCSPVCPRGALFCLCGVLGPWLLFTGVPARCVVLRVRCPRPHGSCSPVCQLGALLCVCGVLCHLAVVHRCASSVCCVACAVSWSTWLLFTGVPARCVVLRVPCPGPLGSCSPVCPLGASLCMCGVLGHLAPVHRCARSVLCFAAAVSWATWLLFTGVPARCVVLRVRCPGPLGSCSPACVVLRVRCPWPLRSCSPMRPLGLFCCVCGVLGHLAPVHRCACSVRCCAAAVSWATLLLFIGVLTPRAVLFVRYPRLLGSCSPVCQLRPVLCSCGVPGNSAPPHQCARSVCCVVCTGSLSLLCSLCVLCWVCGVLGFYAPVHRCACSVCCAVGCVCQALLQGAHSSIRTAAIHSQQGLGSLPGAHSFIRTAAVKTAMNDNHPGGQGNDIPQVKRHVKTLRQEHQTVSRSG